MGLDSYIFRVEKGSPSCQCDDEIWYAREANALHKWFVDNIQDKKNEYQMSLISQEKFEKLKIILDKIADYWHNPNLQHLSEDNRMKEIKDKCAKLLPTQSGFFSKSNEYDYYFYLYPILDLRIEIEHLDMKKYNYYYHASW